MPNKPRITLYKGDYAKIGEGGRRILWVNADLASRLWLNETGVALCNAGDMQAACMLIHAEQYLSDRLAYELYPWPKGMFKVTVEDVSDAIQ